LDISGIVATGGGLVVRTIIVRKPDLRVMDPAAAKQAEGQKNACATNAYPQVMHTLNYEFGKTFLTESKMRESGLRGWRTVARGQGELKDAV